MDTVRMTRVSPRVQVFLTALPIVSSLAILVVLYVLWPWDRVVALKTAALATFFYLGKFVIVTPAFVDQSPFGPYELALLVIYMDICVAIFVAGNLHVLYKIPWVGARLSGMERYGRHTLSERPIMRQWARMAIGAFVMFPIAGTGAIGGAILGRLLGVRLPWIVISVALGAVLGCLGMALLADLLEEQLVEIRQNTWFQVLGVAIVLAIVGAFAVRAARINRKLEAIESEEDA